MGTVYSAYDADLDRKVAVKVVREDVHRGQFVRARLLKEAKAMARISHPNVVHVYEVGEDRASPHGQIFIAMEFVAGQDLVDWQQQHPVRDAVSLDRCLRMYLQAAAGIAAAHRSNLIHRDFKPD
jgi:serine/threonine protein kinase